MPQSSPVTISYHLLQVLIVPVWVGSLGAVKKDVCGAAEVEDTQAEDVVPTQYESPTQKFVPQLFVTAGLRLLVWIS